MTSSTATCRGCDRKRGLKLYAVMVGRLRGEPFSLCNACRDLALTKPDSDKLVRVMGEGDDAPLRPASLDAKRTRGPKLVVIRGGKT